MLEDDPDNADISKNHLQQAGLKFHATIAPAKKDYIKQLEEHAYDVILCGPYLK